MPWVTSTAVIPLDGAKLREKEKWKWKLSEVNQRYDLTIHHTFITQYTCQYTCQLRSSFQSCYFRMFPSTDVVSLCVCLYLWYAARCFITIWYKPMHPESCSPPPHCFPPLRSSPPPPMWLVWIDSLRWGLPGLKLSRASWNVPWLVPACQAEEGESLCALWSTVSHWPVWSDPQRERNQTSRVALNTSSWLDQNRTLDVQLYPVYTLTSVITLFYW